MGPLPHVIHDDRHGPRVTSDTVFGAVVNISRLLADPPTVSESPRFGAGAVQPARRRRLQRPSGTRVSARSFGAVAAL